MNIYHNFIYWKKHNVTTLGRIYWFSLICSQLIVKKNLFAKIACKYLKGHWKMFEIVKNSPGTRKKFNMLSSINCKENIHLQRLYKLEGGIRQYLEFFFLAEFCLPHKSWSIMLSMHNIRMKVIHFQDAIFNSYLYPSVTIHISKK